MSEYYKELLLIYAFAIVISLVWFGIHLYLKRKAKNGVALSVKEKEWMGVSKFAGLLFLILPLIFILIEPLIDKVIGILIVIFIGLCVIIPSLLRKGKF